MSRAIIFTLLLCPTLPGDVRVVEQIVCKVNGDIVVQSELAERRSLGDRIDELLLVQRARDLNLNVDSELTRRIADWQTRNHIADLERAGVNVADLRRQLRDQLLMERVIGEEVQRPIVIPEAARRKYFDEHRAEFVRRDEVWLQKIFISNSAGAETKAKQLADRARQGEKFGALAGNDTDVDLPPYQRGQLRREIEDVVFQAKKGYITDPLRIPEGWLILKVLDRHEKGPASFEDVEQEIAERLARPQFELKLRAYLTRLRQDAFLQIREGYLDEAAAPGKDTSWQAPPDLKPQTITKQELAARHRKKFLHIIP